jgi:uncharacterized protein (DUF697 family)
MKSNRIIECRQIIQSFAIAIAGIAAIPIPFADFFLMAPLQIAMVITIAKKYNRTISYDTAKALVGTIAGGFLGRLLCSTVVKFIPFIGSMISMPFAYGWTFGIGEMAILYFETQGSATPEDLKEGFKKVSKEAEQTYSKNNIKPDEALESIKSHLSEEEYLKLKEKIFSVRNDN